MNWQIGNAIYIKYSSLRKFGDPDNEPWFYPIPLSAREASLFLMLVHILGSIKLIAIIINMYSVYMMTHYIINIMINIINKYKLYNIFN